MTPKSNSSRRRFFQTTSSVAALAGMNLGWGSLLSASELEADPAGSTEKIFTTKPHLQGASENSVAVVCSTTGPAVVQIDYGTGNKLTQKAMQICDGQVAAALTTNHRIWLHDLTPGTQYQYQITVRPIIQYHAYRMKYGEAITLPKQQVRCFDPEQQASTFLLFNDLHDNLKMYDQLQSVVDNEKFDGVVGVGDIFDDPADEAEILHNLGAITSRYDGNSIPFIFQRGNHETRGEYCLGLKDHFAQPNDRYYYAFTHAHTRFIALDTGEDKEDSHREYSGLAAFDGYIAKQTKWLEQELASEECRRTKHRVVFCHIPLYNNTRGISRRCRKQWAPLLNEAKIDLVFSGHTHSWRFHAPESVGDHQFQVIIGGGKRMHDGTVSLLRMGRDSLALEMKNAKGETLGQWTKS